MTLFERDELDPGAPLAARMRPQSLEELAGQSHITAPGSIFRRALESDRLPSVISTQASVEYLARVIAGTTHHEFQELSASAGVKDARDAALPPRQAGLPAAAQSCSSTDTPAQ